MKLTLLFIISILAIPSPAFAQKGESQIFITPGSAYENNAALIESQREAQRQSAQDQSEKIEPDIINLSFVHQPYMEAKQFGIVMQIPNAVTGCFTFTPLEYKASFIDGNYMDITVDSYRRSIVKGVNVAADCNQKNQTISGIVIVNANDLQKRNIRKIRFSNGKTIDNFDIKINEKSITFTPESMTAFRPLSLVGVDKDHVIHHFQGEQTIIALHVPMATKQDDVTNALRKLAYQNSLVPILESDSLDTSGKENVFYFTDPNNNLLEGLNNDGYLEIGEISIIQPYLNQNGTMQTQKNLKVFATRPGTKL